MISFKGLPVWAGCSEDFLRKWLNQIAEIRGVMIKNLAYYFVDDEEILRINKSYLKHNYYTDIITFGYEEGEHVSGEVFISYETVSSNAKRFNEDKGNELMRVIAHGLLHLMGFNDKSEEEREVMRREEENCLILQTKILEDK